MLMRHSVGLSWQTTWFVKSTCKKNAATDAGNAVVACVAEGNGKPRSKCKP